MPEFTDAFQRLLAAYRRRPEDIVPLEVPRIKISEVVSRFAFVYEKIRNAVDFKEEHLLRRNAIERFLRRRLLIENRGSLDAKRLIDELIRARYLPNNKLPETKISDVQNVMDRYLVLLANLPQMKDAKRYREYVRWILTIASADVEEHLVSSRQADGLVECMEKMVGDLVILPPGAMDERERGIQLYLAIHRALIKSDDAILRYHLFYFYHPEWREAPPEIVRHMSAELPRLKNLIDTHLANPWGERMSRFIKKYASIFRILQDTINSNFKNLDELLQNPEALDEAVQQVTQARYKQARVKLGRIAVRSIIYIFLTKMLLAIALEIPVDILIHTRLIPLPLYVNILFHPMLMAFIALTVRLPTPQNTLRIIQGVREVVYGGTKRVIFIRVEKPLARGGILNVLFTVLYGITAIVTFGGIIWFLTTLRFTVLSGFLFIFFLSVVSFFGLKVRNSARELIVVERKESIFVTLIDFFSLPVLRLGRWISLKAPKINVFIFLLDFIIEAPFKSFIEITDQWLAFVREKKEEIS